MKTINLNISLKSIYHPFNDQELSKDVIEYLLEKVNYIRFNESCEIKIHIKEKISEKEKNKIMNLIKKSFNVRIKRITFLTDIEITKNIILFFGGLLFLIIVYFFKMKFALINEILLIIGWVGIWESVSGFIFDIVKSIIRIKRYKQLKSANIIFE
ncbi:MAG: hypothetical protein E7172_01595 [Firmicutes bacterium]|nr:hypothetical protein [Bacillota bacterium]